MTRETDLSRSVEQARRHPTAAQCGRLYAIGAAAGISNAAVKAEMQARYGVESASDLNLRQYEALCTDLARMAGAGRAGSQTRPETEAGPGAGLGTRPTVRSLQDCQQLLERAWPELIQEKHRWQLARDVALSLDAFRLTRAKGIWSEALARTTIERMKKHGYQIIAQTVAIYLERYTSRDERWFLGICRRLYRDSERERRCPAPPAPSGSMGSQTRAAHTPHTTPPPTGPRPELSEDDRARFRQQRPGATK